MKFFNFKLMVLFAALLGAGCENDSPSEGYPGMQKLDVLAKIVLKKDYASYLSFTESLKHSGQETFSFGGSCYLNPFYNLKKEGCATYDYFFLQKAAFEYHAIEPIDWTGEDYEHQFANYVKRRLSAFGLTNFSSAFWDEQAKKVLKRKKLERGDFVIAQFDAFQQHLKKMGYYLLLINDGSDTYYPFVVDKHDYMKLNGLVIVESFKVEEWGAPE